jgi:prophage antirepressor-like protein
MSQASDTKASEIGHPIMTINKVFTSNSLSIRVIGTADDPWFSAKDIATQLGYKQPDRAISDNIKDEGFKAKLGELIERFKPGRSPGLNMKEFH